MTTQFSVGDPAGPDEPATRPPMPSIAASALIESQRLVARARRTVADWLTRSAWTG